MRNSESEILSQIYDISKGIVNNLNIDQINLKPKSEKDFFELESFILDKSKNIIKSIGKKRFDNFSEVKSISDIEFGYNARKSVDETSPFYKGGIEITPNPTKLIDEKNKKLFYYFEVYPESFESTSTDSINIEIIIKDAFGNPVIGGKKKKANRKIIAEVGGYDLNTLKSGAYFFTVNLLNADSKLTESKTSKFYLGFNLSQISEENSKSGIFTFLESVDTENLDIYFEKLSYVATDQEKTIYKSLSSISDKQKFIEKFVGIKASEAGQTDLDFWNSYFERIKFTEDNYTTLFKKGWKSDRGRIYIMYGQPSDIERSMSSTDTKPYETWTYNSVEGGVIFIFGDISENGNYELLHSTKRGEKNNENWQNLVQMNQR